MWRQRDIGCYAWVRFGFVPDKDPLGSTQLPKGAALEDPDGVLPDVVLDPLAERRPLAEIDFSSKQFLDVKPQAGKASQGQVEHRSLPPGLRNGARQWPTYFTASIA